MKAILLLVFSFLLIPLLLFGQGQDYYALIEKAETLQKNKEYLFAAQQYQAAISSIPKQKVHPYNKYMAASCWTMAGKKKEAFQLLTELVEKDYYFEIEALKEDTLFVDLHKDSTWEKLLTKTKQFQPIIKEIAPFYELQGGPHMTDKLYKNTHVPLDGKTASMIPYRIDDKYGFVAPFDNKNWLLQPSFDHVFAVYKQGAIVQDSLGLYGLVQPNGKYLIPSEYKNIFKEKKLYHAIKYLDQIKSPEGIYFPLPKNRHAPACALNDYYDENGKLLFSERAQKYNTFIGDDQYAWFRFGKTYSIRNRAGTLVKQFEYDENKKFLCISNDFLIYSQNIKDVNYLVAYDINDHIAFQLPIGDMKFNLTIKGFFKLNDNLYGIDQWMSHGFLPFFDSLGNQKDFDLFDYDILDYSEDEYFYYLGINSEFRKPSLLVINQQEGGFRLIDQKGKLILGIRARIKRSPDGLYHYHYVDRKNGLLYDQYGTLIPTYQHELILNSGFYDGLCLSKKRQHIIDSIENVLIGSYDQYYYFNKEGTVELELSKDIKSAGNFSEGLAPATNQARKLGFINKKGQWVVQPSFDYYSNLLSEKFIGGYAYLGYERGYININGLPLFADKKE